MTKPASEMELAIIAEEIGNKCSKIGHRQVKVDLRHHDGAGERVIIQFNKWRLTEVKPEDERRALAQFALSIDGIENSCYPKPCRAVRTECIVFNVPSEDRVINSL